MNQLKILESTISKTDLVQGLKTNGEFRIELGDPFSKIENPVLEIKIRRGKFQIHLKEEGILVAVLLCEKSQSCQLIINENPTDIIGFCGKEIKIQVCGLFGVESETKISLPSLNEVNDIIKKRRFHWFKFSKTQQPSPRN